MEERGAVHRCEARVCVGDAPVIVGIVFLTGVVMYKLDGL